MWGLRTAPELFLFRVQTPRAEVLFLSWNWSALTEFARRAKPLQGDAQLFEEAAEAPRRSWRKIDKRKGREG